MAMPPILILIAAFPVVFLLHDFEEIIMFRPWLNKNRSELKKRYPTFEHFLAKKQIYTLSTSAFAVAVLHEFLLVSAITCLSLWYNDYHWWFAAFSAYFLHLFVHVAQWLLWRKYVPVIITTFLTMPYCFYTLHLFVQTIPMDAQTMLLWAMVGIIITLLSFPSAYYFAQQFEKWEKRHYEM